MNNSYITIIKEKRTALSRKRIPLNQNGCTANFRIGVPFEQNLHIEHWTQIMNECLNSGMNKTEWCRANGISDKQFFYWQRILRKEAFATSTSKDLSVITDPADETSPQKISFAEISIPIKQESVRNGFHPDIILRKGPVSVEISNSVSAELLSRIGDIFHAE